MKSVDYFSGMILITTAGTRLLHFQDDFGPSTKMITAKDVVKVVTAYPHANLPEVIAFLEMTDSVDFQIEEMTQIDPTALSQKVQQYCTVAAKKWMATNEKSERMAQKFLTATMLLEMIDGDNVATAPTKPQGKKVATWGALKHQ